MQRDVPAGKINCPNSFHFSCSGTDNQNVAQTERKELVWVSNNIYKIAQNKNGQSAR